MKRLITKSVPHNLQCCCLSLRMLFSRFTPVFYTPVPLTNEDRTFFTLKGLEGPEKSTWQIAFWLKLKGGNTGWGSWALWWQRGKITVSIHIYSLNSFYYYIHVTWNIHFNSLLKIVHFNKQSSCFFKSLCHESYYTASNLLYYKVFLSRTLIKGDTEACWKRKKCFS